MSMRLYAVAASFGGPSDGGALVVSTWMATSPELACSQIVSEFYRQNIAKPPLTGIAVKEIMREYMQQVMQEMDKGEDAVRGNVVVQLVRDDGQSEPA